MYIKEATISQAWLRQGRKPKEVAGGSRAGQHRAEGIFVQTKGLPGKGPGSRK